MFAENEEVAHFALCDQLRKRISQGRISHLSVTLDLDLLQNKQACEYCLHAVSYEGFDVYRHRHQDYNERILKGFNLLDYLQKKHQISA